MEKVNIKLVCSKCLSRNYSFYKRKDSTEKLELKKYCKHCNESTIHSETR